MSITGKDPICKDGRDCFGALPCRGGYRKCRVLTSTYPEDGMCPFAKLDPEVTDGERYPFDSKYGKGE